MQENIAKTHYMCDYCELCRFTFNRNIDEKDDQVQCVGELGLTLLLTAFRFYQGVAV